MKEQEVNKRIRAIFESNTILCDGEYISENQITNAVEELSNLITEVEQQATLTESKEEAKKIRADAVKEFVKWLADKELGGLDQRVMSFSIESAIKHRVSKAEEYLKEQNI